MSNTAFIPPTIAAETIHTLETIQERVLWLGVNMIHHANHVRPNKDGIKVGGHQASSASSVTILTALYFHYLRAEDRIAIKPHSAPLYHGIQYLMGRLSRDYLTQLRVFGGLQPYPSRTKDPDGADFSGGSMGLGAVAPAFAALADQYIQTHFPEAQPKRRFISIVGDAELDEGNVWEALIDEPLRTLGNVVWIVDLNRQSLDRVIPGIKAARLKKLFEACGWHVLEAKYGAKLGRVFAQPDGELLRQRIDEMSNEEYHTLFGMNAAELRRVVPVINGVRDEHLARLLGTIADADLPATIQNLGGHDFPELLARFAEADADTSRPTVIFAYTVKGWHLPFAGDSFNHSKLMEPAQIETLRAELGIGADEWPVFAPDSPAGMLVNEATRRLYADLPPAKPLPKLDIIPAGLKVPASGVISTQQMFGRIVTTLAQEPSIAPYIVTAAPDVSISTHLYDWVRKAGMFTTQEGQQGGQHIELGIAEMNLFMLLGMFGITHELLNQLLIPIGTVYDPFVCRGLDSFIYALYSGAKFIIAGTPSGVTLAPEGGAHQSTVTHSLGTELPNLHYFEPCYAQELTWILLYALGECLNREDGRATYLRLSTKPIDQAPFQAVLERVGEAKLRPQVLAGGYRLLDWRSAEVPVYREYMVHIAATGAMLPEALEAARRLHREGIAANVLHLTSPRKLYENWQAVMRQPGSFLAPHYHPFEWLIPAGERHAPIVAVNDGATHALAWLGSAFGSPLTSLGVDEFGQTGDLESLYRHFGIDADSIVAAAFTALDRVGL